MELSVREERLDTELPRQVHRLAGREAEPLELERDLFERAAQLVGNLRHQALGTVQTFRLAEC